MIKHLTAASIAVLTTMNVASAAEFTVVGDTMTISGSIEQGDWVKFNEVFAENVKHIKLDSPGGSVFNGKWIAEDIAERGGIYTEAVGNCTSMCGIIWLAGEHHIYNKDANIGFHLSYYPNRVQVYHQQKENYGWYGIESLIKKQALESMAMHVEYLDNKAYTLTLIEKLNAEGRMGHNMWYPTDAELVEMEGAWNVKPKPKVNITDSSRNKEGFVQTGYVDVDGAHYGHLYINDTIVLHAKPGSWVHKVFEKGAPAQMAFHTGMSGRSEMSNYSWYDRSLDVSSFYKNSDGNWIIRFDDDTKEWLLNQIKKGESSSVTIGFKSTAGVWGSLTFWVSRV